MRREFAKELYHRMTLDNNIVLITMDLGYKMWDEIREAYPKRFFNVGASEQAGLDIACGMALSGKTVFVYSITPFLLYRAFETLRTYVNHEKILLRLVGGGRDDDYKHDGYSHEATDAKKILKTLPNIQTLWPDTKEEIPTMVSVMCGLDVPQFISLRR